MQGARALLECLECGHPLEVDEEAEGGGVALPGLDLLELGFEWW